jgi:hypothetical protein
LSYNAIKWNTIDKILGCFNPRYLYRGIRKRRQVIRGGAEVELEGRLFSWVSLHAPYDYTSTQILQTAVCL